MDSLTIVKKPNGLFYSFNSKTWKANYQGFRVAVQKIRTWCRAWEFGDPDEYWYFIGKEDLERFEKVKRDYLDSVLEQSLDGTGYQDIPRAGGKFAKRRIV